MPAVTPMFSFGSGPAESVGLALRRMAASLRAAGIESPALEARLLLAHALGVPVHALLRDRAAPVPGGVAESLLTRRLAREPLALILGRREFWSLDLLVSPATLVPRPDSETLVEAALDAFLDRTVVRRILDLGTGTGCLLLAALTEFPAAWGVGVDLSPDAAALARRNAARVGLAGRAAFLAGDWAAALGAAAFGAAALGGGFDLVLCNPPYIPHGEIPRLMPEVALHEPARALDGGEDGLGAYRRVLRELPGLLAPDGAAVLELGEGQAGAVSALAHGEGLEIAALRPDLGGVPRALVLRGPAAKKPIGLAGA